MADAPALEKLMEQAQVFASAWSLVGSQFDFGSAMDDAEVAKAGLRRMLEKELAAASVLREALERQHAHAETLAARVLELEDRASPPVAAPAEPGHEKLIAVLRSARQLVQARAHDIEVNTTLRWVWEKQAADLDEALGSVIAAPQPPRPGTAPLSDEQIETALHAAGIEHQRGENIARKPWWMTMGSISIVKFVRAIEAAHGIGHPATPKDPA